MIKTQETNPSQCVKLTQQDFSQQLPFIIRKQNKNLKITLLGIPDSKTKI